MSTPASAASLAQLQEAFSQAAARAGAVYERVLAPYRADYEAAIAMARQLRDGTIPGSALLRWFDGQSAAAAAYHEVIDGPAAAVTAALLDMAGGGGA